MGGDTFSGCPYEATINRYIYIEDGSWHNIERYGYVVDLMDGNFSTGNLWEEEEGYFTPSGSNLAITFLNGEEQHLFEGTISISGKNITVEGTIVFNEDPDQSVVINAVKVEDSEIEDILE